MDASPELRAFVQAWEGCRLTPYADSVGYMTVGYGHKLPLRCSKQPISQQEADDYFVSDMGAVAHAMSLCVTNAATQQEFDAICSLAFNVGVRAVRDSTLLKKLADGDVNGAANEFPKWSHAGGEVVDGILKRRYAEQRIFLSGDYAGRP